MKKYLLILSSFFLGGISAQTFAGEANLLKLIQTQYQSILSFSGHFTQTSFRANSEVAPRTAEGEVSYKRPGKMRWLYAAPEEQLLVTNGETLWLYDTYEDFKRRKISNSLLKNPQGLIVELEPHKETANLAFIQLEVDPGSYNLRTIVLMDQHGNYRTIALESMSYNIALEDKYFEFEVSAEMEVIEAGNL